MVALLKPILELLGHHVVYSSSNSQNSVNVVVVVVVVVLFCIR